MKVTVALLMLAVAIAAVNCAPSECCGKYEVRVPCGYDCSKPCSHEKPCGRSCHCRCIEGYHRNDEGRCVPNCPSCPRSPYPSVE